ncbi:MAG: 4Fe-4S dicluster domain-containing protein [Bacteroidota bacterium]|nr:4Fe-4S dicluster domain-containing protein [Bacteroidota bacterium]MDP4232465.1 4Fe-4S dicluster domain-containing protein [Bacteroidota bacterium]MDP4241601.1 4Fe-4S dicluster domain-containing protein [Bacteroidota bacterium]MDP4286345.1 4Fe-4S dicluster domain-containing protein [Bacteroidota bacterium]
MEEEKKSNRRKFLQLTVVSGAAIATGAGLRNAFSEPNSELAKSQNAGESVHALTASGDLVQVDTAHARAVVHHPVTNDEARTGIAGKRFVMVIDLAKCDGCKKCTVACQKMHFTPKDREWMKVFEMQDSETTPSYWMPKPCFHCDNPPCTKVCPVNATFKRQDGIVLIDNERCIGCRFCMAACPYSSRFFNWERPVETPEMALTPYSPEQGYPRRVGTVEKCDFCPDMIRQGKMPGCISACAMKALYFGDENEDAVTNSDGETVRLSTLLEQNAGYRYMEDLGTKPRVYYLPPKNRRYPKPDLDHAASGHAAVKS